MNIRSEYKGVPLWGYFVAGAVSGVIYGLIIGHWRKN